MASTKKQQSAVISDKQLAIIMATVASKMLGHGYEWGLTNYHEYLHGARAAIEGINAIKTPAKEMSNE